MIDPNQSRTLAVRPRAGCFLAVFLLAGLLAIRVTQAAGLAATNSPSAIPWNQIGAKAGADYKGDGLAVTPSESGARLHCVFQRLDGEATPEGLWLTSTVTNTLSDRFRVTAMAVAAAEQTAPMRRRVALKVTKLGMDTKQVVAWFEAERQAMALIGDPPSGKAGMGRQDTGIIGGLRTSICAKPGR